MSYTNVYPSRINWENEPSIASPINATNLNKMDYALYQMDQTLETWDVTKANQSDLLLSVKSIDYDTSTGVFVFTWQNGTTKTVDLNIEKIPVSFSMSPQGVITMTTSDGTTYTADVGALIKTYTFTDSSEIDFTVTTDSSGNKTVTASIVAGSITGSKLEPNYLANCQSAANSASGSATAADGSAEDSEAWAVGTRDGVPVPSTDPAYQNNSKYWATQGGANSLAGLSDTDINSPTDGQGLVYDYATSKWKNGNVSSGSTITVFTNESSLYGRTVTLTIGQQTKTETFSNVGVAVFKGIVSTGTFTITSTTSGGDTATTTLNVPYFGNYTKQLTLFSATVTVTFPYSLGATCTLSDGTTTLSANTSPMAFDVPNSGTWTATCTLDGQAKTDSATITTDGQTESLTFSYGTINLTYDNEFRGLSITCTDSNSTITKTAPISGNSMSFYPPNTGTWTISGTYSGTPYSTTATVSSLSTAVSAQLITLPNGSTVTPTDDIQKWLNCAGIFDKTTYSSLSDILSDSVTFNALLGDSNANAYLARSTTFATTLCASQYAMNLIGQYDVCCDALLGNSTWLSAIASSSYSDYVLNATVPKMTSNTAPSGTCFASNESNPAYYAFDGDNSTYWSATDAVDGSIGYQFPSAVCIRRAKFRALYGTRQFTVAYSDDGTTYQTCSETVTATSGETDYYVNTTETSPHQYWRLNVHHTQGASGFFVQTVQFYGHKDSGEYIHGANNETAYYLDGATQVPVSNPSTLDAGTYTFGSTVAKNPDSLATDYTKSIRITPNTVEVVLRPDIVLYWWGYMSSECEEMSTANGWTADSGYTWKTPTYNTNSITITGTASNTCGIAKKTALSSGSTLKAIVTPKAISSFCGWITSVGQKNISSGVAVSNTFTGTVNTTMLVNSTNTANYYPILYTRHTRSFDAHALWYE